MYWFVLCNGILSLTHPHTRTHTYSNIVVFMNDSENVYKALGLHGGNSLFLKSNTNTVCLRFQDNQMVRYEGLD